MKAPPVLLSDEAMQRFIRCGYVTVRADMPPGFHNALCDRLDKVLETEGNPGNNLLPREPEILEVFEHPAVRGALISVLGPDYVMHPHRYAHRNLPGSQAQRLHKDSTQYSGDTDIRDHRCRWAMAFYYPQDVIEDMGPTTILPGTQYYENLSQDPDNAEMPICGEAGTVTIVHFDIWHRGLANIRDRQRYMLKFVFARTTEPERPSWNYVDPEWHPGGNDKHPLLWQSHWNWLRGERYSAIASEDSTQSSLTNLMKKLNSANEGLALNAAYALSAVGLPAIPLLTDALSSEEVQTQSLASLALSLIGPQALPDLLRAASHQNWKVRMAAVDAISEVFPPTSESIAALNRALEDENDWVRRHAADALGTLGPAAGAAAEALAGLLQDEKPYVRINAATALMKLGPAASSAVPALAAALWDSDRYTRGFAALALRRVGTSEATDVLLDALIAERWCPITNVKAPY